MTFLDLCAGIGGFSLGLERAGMTCVGQVEIDDYCNRILARHWPHVPRWGDITALDPAELPAVDLMAFGDPCPKHSRARSNGDSRHPDLSGFCLSLAGRCRPWWVVRENVPASTVGDFACALEHLGYGTVVVRMDAVAHTAQSRQRDYVVGAYQVSRQSLRMLFCDFPDGAGRYTTRFGTREVIPALTTHRTRYDSRDCYIWHSKRGLRILDAEEREAFAGFPENWTVGLSEATRARMYGNSAHPACIEDIGRVIMVATAKGRRQ